jgi:RimJ/RimL family protein N-acetyltransferase
MHRADLDELVDLQEQAAVVALANVFPQDLYPFPRNAILERWRREIEDPSIYTYVCADDSNELAGFAAIRENELLHFGVALPLFGSGVANALHDYVVGRLLETTESEHFRLRVFEENPRARRFYEKQGWQISGQRTQTTFPPHPWLVEYRIDRKVAADLLP